MENGQKKPHYFEIRANHPIADLVLGYLSSEQPFTASCKALCSLSSLRSLPERPSGKSASCLFCSNKLKSHHREPEHGLRRNGVPYPRTAHELSSSPSQLHAIPGHRGKAR